MYSKIRPRHYLVFLIAFVLIGGAWMIIPCRTIEFRDTQKSTILKHQVWDELLHEFVDNEGMINYKGFITERARLQQYLTQLSRNPPDKESWSQEEQLAYWINAYNAYTIALIIEHYPLSGIKDIGSSIQIPFVNSPWDIKFIEIGGKKINLNNIEHSILRKEFNEPRIHFAIVCASMSCPQLRNEAYTASALNAQLDEQASAFINDRFRNDIASDRIEISKIFQWFTGDFTKNGTLIDFLNKYSKIKIQTDADITYKKYDWTLNEQKEL
ncbi:MAG: DUF547 domain-containing protein [Bacteroidetes bacterium]|nr:DUF547 domain-containing protein [Bacteroidota bacterium]